MAYIGKSPSVGIRNRFLFTATSSQTTFSGADDDSRTLSYTDAKFLDVYLNGVLLDPNTDYTATTGTSVVLAEAAATDDLVEIIAFDTFSLFDGTFEDDVTVGRDLSVTRNVDVAGTITSDGLTVDGSSVLSVDSSSIATVLELRNDDKTDDNGLRLDFNSLDTDNNDNTFGRIEVEIKNHATEKSNMNFSIRNDSGDLTELFVLDKDEKVIMNGSVGIGTTPSNKLDVLSSGAIVAQFKRDNTGGASGGISVGNNDKLFTLYVDDSNGLQIYDGATERARVDASGNLLVSTTSDFASGTVDGIIAQGTAKPAAAFSNTADGQIVKFYQGGNLVAAISVGSSDNISFDALTGGGAGLLFWGAGGTDPYITPRAEGSDNDNVTSLGRGANRFKDLYLGGNLYLGGTASANALDDFEEGTFTPTYRGFSSNPTVTYDGQTSGRYTKIGRQVIANIVLRTDAVSGGSGSLLIGGLPFTADGHGATRAGTLNIGYSSQFGTNAYPQAGYINDANDYVVLTINALSDSRSGIDQNPQVSDMQTGSNDNFIMATLFYTV